MIKDKFGIIRLGNMGGYLALQAADKDYRINVYDPVPNEELKKEIFN